MESRNTTPTRLQPTSRTFRSAVRRDVGIYLGDALDMYPHWPNPVVIVSDASTGETTLWFRNTEIGWATVHPLLVEHGWEYVGCNVWDKGIAHVSGNTNSKTLRRFPVAP